VVGNSFGAQPFMFAAALATALMVCGHYIDNVKAFQLRTVGVT